MLRYKDFESVRPRNKKPNTDNSGSLVDTVAKQHGSLYNLVIVIYDQCWRMYISGFDCARHNTMICTHNSYRESKYTAGHFTIALTTSVTVSGLRGWRQSTALQYKTQKTSAIHKYLHLDSISASMSQYQMKRVSKESWQHTQPHPNKVHIEPSGALLELSCLLIVLLLLIWAHWSELNMLQSLTRSQDRMQCAA